MKFIVFEGLDRCGKTTLTRAFAEATEQRYTCYDRGTMSCRVFDTYFGRHKLDLDRFRYLENLENILAFSFGLTVVFVDTSPEICHQRGAQYTVSELEQIRRYYQAEISALEERTRARVIVVNGDLLLGEQLRVVESLLE